MTGGKGPADPAGIAGHSAEDQLGLYRAAFDMATDGMIVSRGNLADDRPFVIVHANDAFCRMAGYQAADLLGRPPRLLHGPATCPLAYARMTANLAAGLPTFETLLHYRQDGSTFWAEITSAPIRDAAGTVTHYIGLHRDVTRQRLAEQERQADEERLRLFRSAFDMAVDGIIINRRDPDHPLQYRIGYVNPAYCRMTGYAAAELLGRAPGNLNGPDTDQPARDRMAAAFAAERPACEVLLRYRKDGSTFFDEITTAPIRDTAGGVTHYIGLHRDITPRVTQLRELQALHHSFRALFDENPLPMLVLDAGTQRHLMVNQAAIDFYGWSREEFLAMPITAVKPPGMPLDPRLLAGALRMSDSQNGIHQKADGSIVRVKAATQLHPAAGPRAILAVVWDVTEVDTAREALDRSFAELQSLTDQLRARTEELTEATRLARLGSWWLAADRQTMTWSDEVYSIIDRKREDFPPSYDNCIAVVHPDDRGIFEGSTAVPGSPTGSRFCEARLVRPDGRIRHARIEFRPVSLDDPQGALYGYTQDVTDRWETQQVMMRSEKLAVLGHLTGGIAHDFNNLLTVVTLNLEEVIEQLPKTGDGRALLTAALSAAQRGAELTGQLLSYARQAPLRPQATSLAALFRTIGPLLRRAIGPRCTLRISLADGDCTPLVDQPQLQTALVNIALNARDAMAEGGAIDISGACVTLPSAEFPLEVTPGRYAMIGVSDTGSGIAPELIGRIFEPFYTTRPPGTASGLGLSMVDGFVGQSGGRTLVRSRLGEGTTLLMFLPLAGADAGHATAGATAARERRALLVEDQPAVLATVTRMFNQLGYEVRGVSTAAAALAELDHGGAFDVLFTDVVLPGEMDGIALAKAVSVRAPAIRILLTSGFSQYNVPEADLPGVSILMKPYKRQDLLDRLNTLGT